ncbi:MAG: DUF952 domain-containing protein [Planctomycetes bacterium]|nr:DUF952 domain-containing protein [Planctomycetota bacterium]
MRRVYHLVAKATWDQAPAGPFQVASLASEGFIHCSNQDQVARSANRFYAGQAELLLLCIDVDRLTSPLRDEPAASGELFPHIYGPINREAVMEVRPMERGPEGGWACPEGL